MAQFAYQKPKPKTALETNIYQTSKPSLNTQMLRALWPSSRRMLPDTKRRPFYLHYIDYS